MSRRRVGGQRPNGLAHGTPALLPFGVIALDGYSQGDGSQHVNFIDDNGHVHELYNP